MQILKQILDYLDGKKNIIAGVIMTTVTYLASAGQLDAVTATYINAVVTLIFGSASVATGKMLGGRK